MVADAYDHRKQVYERQLYNQVPQTALVSQSVSSSCCWSQLGTRCRSEKAADRGLWALSDPRMNIPARMWKKCCYGQKNLGSICSSLSPSPTHLSHTTNINPVENKLWKVYFFYKEECSFVHWSSPLCLMMFRICLYMYCIIVLVCDYITQSREQLNFFSFLHFSFLFF